MASIKTINNKTFKVLVGILIISLLYNYYLIKKTNNLGNEIEHVRGNHYLSYFSTLMYYSNSLDYLVNNASQDHDVQEREMKALYAHSFNLLEHARTYAMLSNKIDNELPDLIWNLAVYIHDITQNLNKIDIENNRNNLKEFSRVINEIIILENQTKMEMLSNNKGFTEKVMYTVLSPKVEKAMGLYLFD